VADFGFAAQRAGSFNGQSDSQAFIHSVGDILDPNFYSLFLIVECPIGSVRHEKNPLKYFFWDGRGKMDSHESGLSRDMPERIGEKSLSLQGK